jgi:hypothetical protein
MLHIDRVSAQVDLLPSDQSATRDLPSTGGPAVVDGGNRERLKALVFEVLRDHLRELERRGVI